MLEAISIMNFVGWHVASLILMVMVLLKNNFIMLIISDGIFFFNLRISLKDYLSYYLSSPPPPLQISPSLPPRSRSLN